MGDEADADWQAGLFEWGYDSARIQGPLIECPRCGEADERNEGTNQCGLCECRFFVQRQKRRTSSTSGTKTP
jgi:late competence protein required for DNA uptake (superfamily II DNA/RNA helicase)